MRAFVIILHGGTGFTHALLFVSSAEEATLLLPNGELQDCPEGKQVDKEHPSFRRELTSQEGREIPALLKSRNRMAIKSFVTQAIRPVPKKEKKEKAPEPDLANSATVS